jgi:uncharacterized membrane protein YdcZ (DUF606 family)
MNSKRHTRTAALCIASAAGIMMPVLAQSNSQPAENTMIKFVVPAVISILSGGVAAFFATSLKSKELYVFRGRDGSRRTSALLNP